MSSMLGLLFAVVAASSIGNVAAVPCGCPTTPTDFSKVILQACTACPTIVVSAPSQTITLTEYSVTSSSVYCPALGTYTCPTGIIVPTSAPCYEPWTASCTIQCELAYTDFTTPTEGCVADMSIYINDVCIESGTTQWPPSTWPSPTGNVSPESESNGGKYPSNELPTPSGSMPMPSGMSPSSVVLPASSTSPIASMATGVFPTKSVTLKYPNFLLSNAPPLPNGRSTWMKDSAAKLSSKLLKNICFPGSHDSGTYGLARQVVNLNGDGIYIARFVNYLSTMNGQMISQLLNTTLDGLAGGGRTTERTITEQLNDGIRAFDFRVAVFNYQMIIHHSMAGPLLTDIVKQITDWLATSQGELLYLQFTHPFGFNHAFSADLRNLLTGQLGGYAFSKTQVQGNTTLPNMKYSDIMVNGTSKVILVVDDTLIDGYPDNRLWTTTDTNWLQIGGDYGSSTAAALFQSFQTDYTKAAGRPIWMTTIISPTTDSIIKIAIQYVLNQYNLGLFKDEVYQIFNDALKDLGVDYTITDDGGYDSLYGWQEMLGVFGGRYNAITSVQNPGQGNNSMFILASDYNEDTTNGDMVGLAIQYATQ